MSFKVEWEKQSTHHTIDNKILEKMMSLAFPVHTDVFYELVPGGCANLNFKIFFREKKPSFNLRIYLRDQSACVREQKLGELLKDHIPLPLTHFMGELEGYRFAITQWMPGISLRELLLGDKSFDRATVMREAGRLLASISDQTFSTSGFFDENLCVVPSILSEYEYAKECLKNKTVLYMISSADRYKIYTALDRYGHLFPGNTHHQLVHGDFDPANILVEENEKGFYISGILDWEFAFSGSYLWDVTTMLRYAYRMPDEFEKAFVQGLQQNKKELPDEWYRTVALLNISSLLDILQRTDPMSCPKICVDICNIINFTLKKLV